MQSLARKKTLRGAPTAKQRFQTYSGIFPTQIISKNRCFHIEFNENREFSIKFNKNSYFLETKSTCELAPNIEEGLRMYLNKINSFIQKSGKVGFPKNPEFDGNLLIKTDFLPKT